MYNYDELSALTTRFARAIINIGEGESEEVCSWRGGLQDESAPLRFGAYNKPYIHKENCLLMLAKKYEQFDDLIDK